MVLVVDDKNELNTAMTDLSLTEAPTAPAPASPPPSSVGDVSSVASTSVVSESPVSSSICYHRAISELKLPNETSVSQMRKRNLRHTSPPPPTEVAPKSNPSSRIKHYHHCHCQFKHLPATTYTSRRRIAQ